MLLKTLGASLLGNMPAGTGIVRSGSGRRSLNSSTSHANEKRSDSDETRSRNCKSWLWKQNEFLMPPYPLTNFEIQEYYQNGTRFNGVYSRNNLPKRTKDETYVINLDEYADIGTHWVALF